MRRSNVQRLRRFALSLLPLLLACEVSVGGIPRCADPPAEGLYATFRVIDEHFHASITGPAGIAEAIAVWQGSSSATIPIGDLICSPEEWNCLWNWHLDPASIRFAEVATEVCDARPSHVEESCDDFPQQYCPWSARMVELRDCRNDSSCPPVPR